jgi:hypothetical protein
MAEDDEPSIDAEPAADAASPPPEGAHRPYRWTGLKLITQLGVPLVALAVGIAVVAGGGLGGGGDDAEPSPTIGLQADDVCIGAFGQARQIVRDPELPPGRGEWAALPDVLRDTAQRLEESDSPDLAPAFAEQADALDDLVAVYEARPRLIRLARSRLRDASREAEAASLNEGERSCARLARAAGAPSRVRGR